MHAPSIVELLATGLVAASAVTGFHGPATSGLAVRYAGALVVAAAGLPTALGAPAPGDCPAGAATVEARAPEPKEVNSKSAEMKKIRNMIKMMREETQKGGS